MGRVLPGLGVNKRVFVRVATDIETDSGSSSPQDMCYTFTNIVGINNC
jgi:hypothetical protein